MSSPQASNPSSQPGSIKEYVRPFFCCDVKHNTYFKFYTIYIITISCFSLLLALLFSFEHYKFLGVAGSVMDIPFLILASLAYSKFDDSGNYGQKLHVCFSVTALVWFTMVLLINTLSMLMFSIFGIWSTFTDILPDEVKPHLGFVISVYFVIILPYSIYNVYLSYLYYRVTKVKMERNKEHLKELVPVEDTVIEVGSQTPVS